MTPPASSVAASAAAALRWFDIDIVGTCNLRCPSCPVGAFQLHDFAGPARAKGFMAFETFTAILDKIAAETDAADPAEIMIALFNWGEPLLHPEIARFVAAAKGRGHRVFLSTNFNIETDFAPVVRAGPDWWRVSLSGYRQETYGRTHRRGRINLVKSNLYRLRDAMDRQGRDFRVDVHYHLYRGNLNADLRDMVRLCQELGFRFDANRANYMALEKNLAYFAGHVTDPAELAIIDDLLLRPEETSEIARRHNDARPTDCTSRRDKLAINHDGSVALCCSVYDPANNIAPNLLDLSFAEIQARRYAHPLCGACYAHGLAHNDKTPDEIAELDRRLGERFNQFSIYRTGPGGITFD